ncbi:MAG: 1,4-dihydroxy-2-naphthoate polyprenyltransferase [Anaerolineales bacterium]|nr:1,4-dihydroxy-2-naphthoate polyprenyltransferase [Anaerolineales bacterium]
MFKETGFWKVWILASRPKTLPAAAAGVVMGSAMAWFDGSLRIDTMLVCLVCALLLQISSNLANDVFDFERGTDTAGRLGPMRVTQAGLLTPRQVKTGLIITIILAAVLGLYLVWLRGLPILLIGIAAILSAVAYTGGPFPLGYYGLGEILVFLFFGLASVIGTYYVQTGVVTPPAVWMAIPPGMIITAILVVNNLRDLENDREAGKNTLAVILGESATKIEYAVCIAIAYLVLPLAVWATIVPWTALLTWLSLPLALKAMHETYTKKGRPLNAALAATGRTALAFSLLFWAGLLFRP